LSLFSNVIEDVDLALMDFNAIEFDLARSALANSGRRKTSKQSSGAGELLVVAYDSRCDVSGQHCVHAPVRYQKIDGGPAAVLMYAANYVRLMTASR
jgi:hypothetical protein